MALCSALHVIYCAVYGTAVKQKMKESPVGLLLAQNRKQILFHAHSLREHDIVIFMTFPSVSLYNKQKKYELHSRRISASNFLRRDSGVKERVDEYFLLEWAVKLTVKWVSEQGSVRRILCGKREWAAHLKAIYDLNTDPDVKSPQLRRNLAVNPAIAHEECSTSLFPLCFLLPLKCCNGLLYPNKRVFSLSHPFFGIRFATYIESCTLQ